MTYLQLDSLRESNDGPGLIAQLQDLCTWLCVGGEQYVHQFEVFPYTAALLPLVNFPNGQVQVLALRALALEVEQVPRGVVAVSKDNGIPILLEKAANLDFMDPISEAISEELIKILAVLSNGAHKAMVLHNAIPVVLSLATTVPNETTRYSCYNCVCVMVSVCTPDNFEVLIEAMVHVVDVISDKVGFVVRLRSSSKDNQANSQQNARAVADEQIIFVVVRCLCHLLDRIGLSQAQMNELLDNSVLSPTIPLLLSVLDMTSFTQHGDGELRRAVLSFFTTIFQSAPRSLLYILNRTGGWNAVVSCVASMANGNARHSSHAAPDAASLTGIAFTTSAAAQSSSANSGRTSGLDASLEQDTDHLALLDFLLLVLPSDQPNESIILTRPYHVWSWEDDFHNTVEYDESISWRLEREYQRQRAVGRFIPCEVVHMIRYFVSFERMRQLTPQGALSRTVMRSPILSHFLHTRSAANMTCTCQSAYSNNNSFSVHPAATTSRQMTPRAASKEEKPGWFSSMFGCCCSSDAVKEAPRHRKNRDSMISALDSSAPLSIFRFAETQLEIQETMADALGGNATLVNLFKPILHVAQRTANPLILRHCCTILSRLLGLVVSNGPASNAVPGSTASQDSGSGRRQSGSVVPPEFLVELQEDMVSVFAYSISVCSTSQVDRLLAVMSAKDLAAEGFEETSTVPVHNYLASPTAPNENDPLSMVVTFSVLGDLLVSACSSVNHLVALLGAPVAKRFTSQGTATDLAFLGKQIQTTPGVADQHCPRHSSKLYTLKAIMDAIHATYSTIQEATDSTHQAPTNMGVHLPASPTLALPAYTVSDANASSGAFSSQEDDGCPSALKPVWRLYKESEEGGALEASTSGDGCLLCAAVDALKTGGVTLGGTKVASGRQALVDYISTKDASVFRSGLQRFTVRLMKDISNKLPLSGTFVADSFNVSKGPKALNSPNSITAAVVMEKALKPIGLRILPLGDTHPSDDPTPPTLSIPGYAPLPLLTIPKAIKEFTLHTFAFATVSQIAEEIATRYNDSLETAFPGMLQRAHDDWITESISTMHDAVSTSASHHHRRRSTNASRDPNDETDTLHPNRFPNSADSSDSTPMISTSSPVPEEITPSPPQWPSINAKQVLLFINRVPIFDRSMSFLDALLRNELTAGGMRRLLESVPSQYNRALVQQALSLWGHTYRLTFVVLESPLDLNALPSEHGCHCGSIQEPALASPTASAAAAASAPTDDTVTPEAPVAATPNQLTVRPPAALYKVDQLPVCSPWHLFADKDLQDHWVCDALRLLEQLIDLVVTPYDPTMLVEAGQRLYSVLLHNCKLQTIAFTLPALSHLVHPSIRPLQHALSPSTPRGAEGLAEYILWNHPSILPLPIRILYFNHISGARGSATTKGANRSGGGRVVGGGGWVLPIRNRNQPSPKKIKVTVRRDSLLADAEEVLTTYALCPLPLDIEFEGEPGSGVGPTIEFFSLVAKELTAYSSEMWTTEADGMGITSPSPSSPTVPKVPSNGEMDNTSFTEREKSSLVYDEKAEKLHHKEQYASGRLFPRFPPTPRGIRNFALLGHLIARGLQDGRTMNMWLHPVFLDRLLGKSMKADSRYDGGSVSNLLPSRTSIGSIGSLNANVTGGIPSRHLSYLMARVDPQMEQSLQRLLAMSEEDLAVMDIVFTVPGTDDSIQLCEGGLEIVVTRENVAQYCDAVRHVLCCTSVDIPARTVLEGLNRSSIIPGHMRLFTGPEFEVLLSGHRGKVWATEEQLRRDVTCAHGYNSHSKAIQFFITAVVSFSAELQRRFLLFISGSDCLPAGGLNPPIQIVRKGLDPEASPIRKRRVKSGAVSPAVSHSLPLDNESEGSLSSSTTGTPIPQHLSQPALIPLTLPTANMDLGLGDGSTSASPPSSARSNQTNTTMSIGIGTRALTLEGEEEVEVRLTTQEQVDECLPTVNTCFHYLKLPDYSSEEVLKNRLLVAVYEGQGTFQLS